MFAFTNLLSVPPLRTQVGYHWFMKTIRTTQLIQELTVHVTLGLCIVKEMKLGDASIMELGQEHLTAVISSGCC